ncbi:MULTISPECIES: hypothetical protein [Polymorphospora]|uniref:Uncharacterized protein n=1 Tax=Polymorphospora lycopeni TaxID=3140240 RepID=A0ABV5CLC0_9ACTN
MPEPLTIAAVSAIVLAEGVRFLYDQTGAWLERRRERNAARAAGQEEPAQEVVAVSGGEQVLDQPLRSVTIDHDVLAEREREILTARAMLSPYREGHLPASGTDQDLLTQLDTLRRLAETVVGQRLTFVGEPREATGVRVKLKQDVKKLRQPLRAVHGELPAGSYEIDQVVEEADGPVTGLDFTRPTAG